ncbi:MAG TPA: hypothetical protein VMT17_19105 [Anaeromyxobacteraceae bacterium]|nr:hypothetical protein [Anaeromyxobacteraceae bacterium]
MAFDFADAKRRFAASRRIHPSVVEALIAEHEEALALLREVAARGACPVCGAAPGRGSAHARGCRLARVIGAG